MPRNQPKVSHLTATQAGRFVGVSQPAVAQRNAAGKLASIEVYGVEMFAVADLAEWKYERAKRERRLDRQRQLVTDGSLELDR